MKSDSSSETLSLDDSIQEQTISVRPTSRLLSKDRDKDEVNDLFLTALKLTQQNKENTNTINKSNTLGESLNFLKKFPNKNMLALPISIKNQNEEEDDSFKNGGRRQSQQSWKSKSKSNSKKIERMGKQSVSPIKNKPLGLSTKNYGIEEEKVQHFQHRFSVMNPKQFNLTPSKSQTLAFLKRNTIGDSAEGSQTALNFSLLRTLVKSQTQNNHIQNLTSNQNTNEALAILSDINHKAENKLFTRKSLKVINFTPTDWKRFDGCPLRPGINFFKIFQQLKPESLQHLNKVIFPDTLISFDRLTWLKYDFNERKYNVRSNDFILPFYLRKTKAAIEAYHKSDLKWDDPMAIEKRFPPLMSQTFKTVMNEESFQNYLLNGLEQSCIIQTYIKPAFANKPAFYRIVYRNQSIKQSKRKPNYGFLLSSTKQVQEEQKQLKNSLSSKPKLAKTLTNFNFGSIDPLVFTQKHIVNIDQDSKGDYDVYMIRNFQVIESRLEDMVQELLHFISQIYGFRIKQIVVDFIKDYQGNYFLTDVKNFTFDEYDKIRYLALKSQSPQFRQQNKIELLQRACMTAKCQLCRQKYRPAYVQNTITKKMLYKLNAHLTKRGVFLLQHLSKFQFQQEFCKVCDQCNQLVIAELELMEVERLYAIAQNIPSKEYNKIKKDDETKIQVSALATNQLTQWRLMFMIKEIRGVSQEQMLDKCTTGAVYLHLKILDFITTLEICRQKIDTKGVANNNNIFSYIDKTREGVINLQNAINDNKNLTQQQQTQHISPFKSEEKKGQNVFQRQSSLMNVGGNSLNGSTQSTKELKIPGFQKKLTISKLGDEQSIQAPKITNKDLQNSPAQANMLNSKLNVIYEYQAEENKEPSILVNRVRVHFFFTLDNNKDELWRFLQNTEIEMRITDGPYWEGALLATCHGFPFQYFNTNLEVQLQPWQYYLFGEINKLNNKEKEEINFDDSSSLKSHNSYKTNSSKKRSTQYDSLIDFTVSLKRDQKVQISENVDLYQVAHGVLFPENNYFSPLPMPKEWIEIIQIFNRERIQKRGGHLEGRSASQQMGGLTATQISTQYDPEELRQKPNDNNLSNEQQVRQSKVTTDQLGSSRKPKTKEKKQSFGELPDVMEFNADKYDGIKNTPFSKDMKQNFSHSLKIFQTVQDQNLLSKKLSTMNSVSPIFQKYNKSRNITFEGAVKQVQPQNQKNDQILSMAEFDDITDDQILVRQLKLIDAKNQTLREVNTHYDPKYIYSSTQAVKKLQQIKKQKEKMAIQELNQLKNQDNYSNQNKFGGKQERYKYKNYQIDQSTISEQRKMITYQLKKKNYQAIKDIISSKKQQMLNIIPDDNFIVQHSPSYQKNRILAQTGIIEGHFNNNNQHYGDHLTVSRKNSLQNLKKKPSMIVTKVSTDKLDVYNPLYSSQMQGQVDSLPYSHSNSQLTHYPNNPQRTTSIVKQKNSNLLQSSIKNVNVFQIVSQTYKDYEKQQISRGRQSQIQKIQKSDDATPNSRQSGSKTTSPDIRASVELKQYSQRNKKKLLKFKDLEQSMDGQNSSFRMDRGAINMRKSLSKGEKNQDLKLNILEQDESMDISSKNSHSNDNNKQNDNNFSIKDKLAKLTTHNKNSHKPPMIKTFYATKDKNKSSLIKQDRIQSAQLSTKNTTTKYKSNHNDSNSFLRTTFFNTQTKLSKISPMKSSIIDSNSTLYANILPWIKNNKQQLNSSSNHSKIRQNKTNPGVIDDMSSGRMAQQVSKAITNQNLEIVDTEIGKLVFGEIPIQTRQDEQEQNDEFQLDRIEERKYPQQSNLLPPMYIQNHTTDKRNIKISKKKRRQMRQKEFKDKYEGILMGELRKGVKSLTRSQQHIPRDIENSLKKTSLYQAQIIKVYGVDGEKKIISESQPRVGLEYEKNTNYFSRRKSTSNQNLQPVS